MDYETLWPKIILLILSLIILFTIGFITDWTVRPLLFK